MWLARDVHVTRRIVWMGMLGGDASVLSWCVITYPPFGYERISSLKILRFRLSSSIDQNSRVIFMHLQQHPPFCMTFSSHAGMHCCVHAAGQAADGPAPAGASTCTPCFPESFSVSTGHFPWHRASLLARSCFFTAQSVLTPLSGRRGGEGGGGG